MHLPHVQLDDLRTRLRAHRAILWLWVALDPVTKLVPAVHLGPRTQASGDALIHALATRLTPGSPPVFPSAGLRLYYYALAGQFGHWGAAVHVRLGREGDALHYGQLKKLY